MVYRKNRLEYLRTGWYPPTGLRRSRPRDVTYTAAGWAVFCSMCVLLALGLVGGIGLGAKANREIAEQKLLEEQGVVTSGYVTRLWRGGDNKKQPYAAYEFEAGGKTYTGRAKVRLSTWRGLELGGEWRVRYAASDPRIHHPVAIPPPVTPSWVPYLVGFLCLGGAFLIWIPLRRGRYLLSEGRVTPGVVTKVVEPRVGSQPGAKHGKVVHFEFPLLSGRVREGKTAPMHKPPAVGQTVCIVYLADEPRRCALYPMTLVKPAGIAESSEKRRPAREKRHLAGRLQVMAGKD